MDPADPWDEHEVATILQRLAVGTAIAHAYPIGQWRSATAGIVDPVVRYMHFETSYKNGLLDPAFPVLTAFELVHTMDDNAKEEDIDWLHTTLLAFRPDTIGGQGYHWRYAESVHSEVQYGDSQCPNFPGVCQGHYSDIPVGGDVCGGRAFWSRFTRKSFGIPTWGATEHAHAAMSSWTPTGWNVMLGAPWPDCWWGDRGGLDFVLETQARANRGEFQKVLRGSWTALARDEDPVAIREPNTGTGGLWSALMLYKKQMVTASSPRMNRTVPAPPPGENKVADLVAKWGTPLPAPPAITTAKDGTISIPAVSFTSKVKSAPVIIIHSADEGSQLVSNGCTSSVGPPCFDPTTSELAYNVTAKTAGSYYLTANFSTYHMNQDLYVSANGNKPVEVGMFYTIGYWNETQPALVQLTEGKNSLTFSRTSGRDVSFKEFTLYVKKPDVPKPPTNFTPVPSPPTPNKGDYIEVPADTTCVGQGIKNVDADDCSHACLALGFKSTGPKARANISGCFVMTEGEYAGNCNFNLNKSATCTPPCTLMGSVVRSLCLR